MYPRRREEDSDALGGPRGKTSTSRFAPWTATLKTSALEKINHSFQPLGWSLAGQAGQNEQQLYCLVKMLLLKYFLSIFIWSKPKIKL